MEPPDVDVVGEVAVLRAKLSASAARVKQTLEDALNEIPAAVLATDDSGRFIGASDRACALTGYTRRELLDKSVSDLTPPGSVPVHDRLWNAFTRTGEQSGHYDIVRKDSTVIRTAYRAFWDVAPGIHVSFLATPHRTS